MQTRRQIVNEQNITQQVPNAALTEDELALIVGGSTDPIDPTPAAAGAVDPDMKAVPILF